MGKIRKESRTSHFRELVSLAQLEQAWNTHRKTIRRSLAEAGVRAVVIGYGRGRNVSIRYYKDEIESWLKRRLEPAGI
jgi:hypothetical protein